MEEFTSDQSFAVVVDLSLQESFLLQPEALL